MNFKAELPIYLQVMDSIKRDIVTGAISPGQKLPSVRELALKYTINPNTASRVYRELESESICFTRRGMGTFVTDNEERIRRMKEEMAQELIRQFIEGMTQLGFTCEEAIRFIKTEKKGE
ncbi:MAG: GntR family transcriptional regulator [Blautia sp.]|nr:GntR family transcriptional regulator [Blautia sp.]MDY4000526.1 GntR family transcriptional regulator [Blautia sp.]